MFRLPPDRTSAPAQLVLVAAPFAEAWIANVGTVGLGFGAAPSVCGLNKGGQQLYTEVVSRARVGEHSAVQRGVLGLSESPLMHAFRCAAESGPSGGMCVLFRCPPPAPMRCNCSQ